MDNNQMYDERVLTTKMQPSITTTTTAPPKTTTIASAKDSTRENDGRDAIKISRANGAIRATTIYYSTTTFY